jgi:2-aminoadipate transaminase
MKGTNMDIQKLLSPLAQLGPAPKFVGAIGSDVIWNFDQGHPAWDTFPIDDLVRIAAEVTERRGPVVMDYFDQNHGYGEVYYGSVPLRERIADYLAETWHQTGTADGVIVTNGSVQAISLAIGSFIAPDDAFFVEGATFPYALRFAQAAGGVVYPVAVDDDGMDLDELERQIAAARRDGRTPKMIYTIATFQMPTGKVLSLPRRKRLLEIAAHNEMVVLEDNIYGVFRYEGDRLPTLLSLDTEGLVIQSDSFAKTTAPGVRLGWATGSPELISVLAGVRQDFGPNQWLQAVMTQYLEEGLLSKQIAEVVPLYRAKRDAVAESLRAYCEPLVQADVPPGSFYYWLHLVPEIDSEKLAEASRSRGLLARPGEMFMGSTDGAQYMRLAFAHVSVRKIELGIAELGKALHESVRP